MGLRKIPDARRSWAPRVCVRSLFLPFPPPLSLSLSLSLFLVFSRWRFPPRSRAPRICSTSRLRDAACGGSPRCCCRLACRKKESLSVRCGVPQRYRVVIAEEDRAAAISRELSANIVPGGNRYLPPAGHARLTYRVSRIRRTVGAFPAVELTSLNEKCFCIASHFLFAFLFPFNPPLRNPTDNYHQYLITQRCVWSDCPSCTRMILNLPRYS